MKKFNAEEREKLEQFYGLLSNSDLIALAYSIGIRADEYISSHDIRSTIISLIISKTESVRKE